MRACACVRPPLCAPQGEEGSEPADPNEVRRQLVAALVADIVLCTKEANKKWVAGRGRGRAGGVGEPRPGWGACG